MARETSTAPYGNYWCHKAGHSRAVCVGGEGAEVTRGDSGLS